MSVPLLKSASVVRTARPAGRPDFAGTVAESARAWPAEPDLDRMLDAVLRSARIALPGVRRASISLLKKQRLSTAARTDEVIAAVDVLQFELGQGPSVDAVAHRRTVRTGDLVGDPRWPALARRAARTGVRSVLSLHLHAVGTSFGSLTVVSDRHMAFDDQAEQLGGLFAAHVAVALLARRQEDGLREALNRRDIIGQAKGILMQRHRVSGDEAFMKLVRTSQDTNIKLHEVAQYIVNHAEHAATPRPD